MSPPVLFQAAVHSAKGASIRYKQRQTKFPLTFHVAWMSPGVDKVVQKWLQMVVRYEFRDNMKFGGLHRFHRDVERNVAPQVTQRLRLIGIHKTVTPRPHTKVSCNLQENDETFTQSFTREQCKLQSRFLLWVKKTTGWVELQQRYLNMNCDVDRFGTRIDAHVDVSLQPVGDSRSATCFTSLEDTSFICKTTYEITIEIQKHTITWTFHVPPSRRVKWQEKTVFCPSHLKHEFLSVLTQSDKGEATTGTVSLETWCSFHRKALVELQTNKPRTRFLSIHVSHFEWTPCKNMPPESYERKAP